MTEEKKLKLNKLSSIALVLVSGLALVFMFIAFPGIGLGWFASNESVDANDIAVVAHYLDVNAYYSVYMSDLDGEGTDRDEEGNLLNVSNINLNPYDTIFLERNEKTPVCIKITVGGGDLPDSGSVTLKITRDVNGDAQSETLSEYVTSIIYFVAGISAELDEQTEADEIYSTAKQVFGQEDVTQNKKMFISQNENGYQKIETISFDINYEASDLTQDAEGNKILNLYVYVRYDDDYAHEFSSQMGGDLDASGLSGVLLTAQNDLRDISLEIK